MAPAPFVIGKAPSVGDFFSRGLEGEAARVLDEWAAAEIEHVQTALGAAFEGCHERAPPLRFILGPSGPFAGWMAGALTPSVDLAGRRFLLIAGIGGLSAGQAAVLGCQAAAQSEEALYDILGSGLTPDAALDRVRACAPEGLALRLAGAIGGVIAHGAWWCEPLDLLAPADALKRGSLAAWLQAAAQPLDAVQ